jgi:hypothetical protein
MQHTFFKGVRYSNINRHLKHKGDGKNAWLPMTTQVHKSEIFPSSDFEFFTISLLVMLKY